MDRLLEESESGHEIERQRDRDIQHSWSYSQLSLKLRSNFVASETSTPVVFLSHPSSLCQSDRLLEAISVFLIFLSLPHSSSFCRSYRLLGTSVHLHNFNLVNLVKNVIKVMWVLTQLLNSGHNSHQKHLQPIKSNQLNKIK